MTDNRTADRASRTLMIVGAALAAVAAATWMADTLPRFPEWMLRLAVYKLVFASGAGLLIAGAVLRRSLRAPGVPHVRAYQSTIDAGAPTFDADSSPVAQPTRDARHRSPTRPTDQSGHHHQ